MWFNTRSGRCRWDGYPLTVDSTIRETSPQISTAAVFRLLSSTWQREGNGRLVRRGEDGSKKAWQLIPTDILAYTHNDHFHVADVNEQTEAISTYGAGLYLYDKPTGELTQLTKGNSRGIIGDDYLTALYVDKTGCIWIVEDYLGVKCLRLNQLQYQIHRRSSRIQDVNHIRCLMPMTDSKLLVGNQTGDISLYDRTSRQWTNICSMNSRLYAALLDSKGRLWLGTRGDGLWCDNRKVEGLPSPHIYKITEDKEGSIWVAMLEGGVAHLSPHGGIEAFLQGKDCHDILQDQQGCIWVAAEDALYQLRNRQRKQVSKGYFVCLCQDRRGAIWAGSIGEGVLKCKGRNTPERLTVKNGLGNGNVYSIVEDRAGDIWIGTEEGLSQLNPATQEIQNHTFSDSQLNNVFCERTAVLLADGRLMFGSHDGLVEVESVPRTSGASPPTTITGLMVNGEAVKEVAPLPHSQNSLTFSFSNFQYAQLQSVAYQYRLDGIDTDWCPPTKEHTAIYRQLPPGHYTFRVRSNNGQSNWGKETLLAIHILQPWWNTWWAWCFYLLLVVVLTTIAARIVHLRHQLEVERRVSAFKMDFYDRIQRELRNPINVLQGATENVKEYGTSRKTMQSLRRGSRRMLKLMDMIQQFHNLNRMEMQVKAEQDAMNQETERRFREIQQTIHAEEAEARDIAPPPINRQTILIAAEDNDNRTHLEDTLTPYFHVVTRENPSDIEALIAKEHPSLILMDVTDDWHIRREQTRHLSSLNPHIPIVHLSPFNDDAHQLGSLRAGAADYIVKPFSGKVLVERIKHLLSQPAQQAATQDSTPDNILTDKKDRQFLFRFQTILSQHIADENFSVEQFAELMHLGRTQFYKRVKALTGLPPTEHVHRARLDYAASVLLKTQKNIEEVMTMAGFHSATHFYNCFRRQFGMSPSDYRKSGGGA